MPPRGNKGPIDLQRDVVSGCRRSADVSVHSGNLREKLDLRTAAAEVERAIGGDSQNRIADLLNLISRLPAIKDDTVAEEYQA